MSTAKSLTCRRCRQGVLHSFERERSYSPPGAVVTVRTLASRCDHCGAETVLASQHDENLRRLQAREVAYGEYLTGEAIFEFRRKYGLTQIAAAKIFGKGLIAFSRYENEKSYPDLTTTRLLRVAMSRPDVLKQLADYVAVEIPLWETRCEEERARKVTKLRPVGPTLRVQSAFVAQAAADEQGLEQEHFQKWAAV